MSSIYIALADDDEDDREIFEQALHSLQREISLELFKDGNALMEFLRNKPKDVPEILFIDINMPLKNGFDCLQEIRNTLNLKDICVIIFSTTDHERDIVRAYDLTANGFIQKPSNFGHLKSMLQKILDTDWKDPCSRLDRLNFVLQP
ncbi:MAG: response regulator [Marinirhabdus sp.]|nr:response regulator [Marinirhabdus sp.]